MVTNYFPVNFPFDEFQISRLPYSDERLRSLRAEHNQSHSFFRNGDHIYVSPMKESGLRVGETVTIKVGEHLDLVASLVRHILFRTVKDAQPDLLPLTFAPLSFLSRNKEFDLARRWLPPELDGVVMFPRLIEVAVRETFSAGKWQLGLLITVRHRWVFKRSVRELIAERYNVVGKPVLEAIQLPGMDRVLAPDETLVGIIRSVDDHSVTVETNQGIAVKDADHLFLRRSRREIGDYLAFKIGKPGTSRVFQMLRDEEPQRVSPAFMLSNARKMARWLSERTYRNLDAFCFNVSRDDSLPGETFKLEPTKFVFGLTPGSSADSILGGLLKHGPYDRARFDKKTPRVLAIFQKANRGYATNFLAKLINGIPESQFYKRGFKDLFKLHDVAIETEELESRTAEGYEAAIGRAIRSAGRPFDLAIVETFEETRTMAPEQNPYLRAKAKLMTNGVSVQCVLDNRWKGSDAALANLLGPIALQLYAKMGGIPWVLPASHSVDREIVVGIGNTIHRKNPYAGAEQSRIVGLTTFFSGEGRYLLGQQLRSVTYDEYFYELLGSLKRSIEQLSAEYAWKRGDNVRLVFHVFKPVKNLEVEVIDQLVRSYPDFRIKHAFVTISQEHPFMMFQNATQDGDRMNVQLCDRGQNLVLNDLSCLLQLRGPKHVRTQRHRFPTPVLIRIHEHSSYQDLQFIAQQILDFSWVSWRSFAPANTPVTIFYSELMARMTRELQHVPGWSDDVVNTHFRNSQWFL